MKHKINHIKAAVVIAIALALIVPAAPVFADTYKQSGKNPTLLNGKMMIVENTSAYLGDTDHLIRVNGSWDIEIFGYDIAVVYDAPMWTDFITITDVNLNGTVGEGAEDFTSQVIYYSATMVEVKASVWYTYNSTSGNGIPAGSGLLLNIVQDILLDSWPQVVDIFESPISTSRYYPGQPPMFQPKSESCYHSDPHRIR